MGQARQGGRAPPPGWRLDRCSDRVCVGTTGGARQEQQ